MKHTLRLLTLLLLALSFSLASAQAADIVPVGQVVGRDGQGALIRQAPVNGVQLGYKLMGTGQPLVLIPGLGGTMDQWPGRVLEVLAKTYQLILVDNRGMGFSTANAESFSYGLYAADVVGLLDALGVKKAHVLGFSMGSTIAQQLLVDAPGRIGKAVLLSTTTDGGFVAAALKGRTFDNPVVLRQLEATARWRSPLDKLSAVPNQTLLLVGTADNVVGTESSKTLAATIPGAWLVQFRNATHGLVLEMPNEFLRLVLTFLDTGEVARGN